MNSGFFKSIFCSVFLLIFTYPVFAASWELVDYTDEMKYYVNTGTIEKSNNKVKVWVMLDFKHPQKGDNRSWYRSRKSLTVFDCKTHSMEFLSIADFSGKMGKGKNVNLSNLTKNSEKYYVVPDSVSESGLKMVCS